MSNTEKLLKYLKKKRGSNYWISASYDEILNKLGLDYFHQKEAFSELISSGKIISKLDGVPTGAYVKIIES